MSVAQMIWNMPYQDDRQYRFLMVGRKVPPSDGLTVNTIEILIYWSNYGEKILWLTLFWVNREYFFTICKIYTHKISVNKQIL